LLVLPLIASCNAILGVAPVHVGSTDDAGADTLDMTDGGMCVGGQRFTYCFSDAEPPSLSVPTSIDTASCPATRTDGDGQTVCVFAARSVTVHSTTAIGKLPLAIVALGDLQILGTVDVSSVDNSDLSFQGAGANPRSCANPTMSSGDTGAAGASNQGVAGDGGASGTTTGGVASIALLEPSGITGGCQGGIGGGNPVGSGAGNGGFGGGAVDFVAGTSITMSASSAVFAAGGGATGGAMGAGGGGGGAGGLIGFDAPSITLAGKLAANGGGGGAGGDGLLMGEAGREGSTTMSPIPAAGGGSPIAGGDGASTTASAGPGASGGLGSAGGGGGGSVGWIIVRGSMTSTASTSPQVTKD